MKFMTKRFVKAAASALIVCATTFGLSAPTSAADVKAATTDKEITRALKKSGGTPFPIGNPNTAYEKYFTGRSFLYPIQGDDVNVANVTFEPSCINHWHIHHGSCQVLVGVSGKGYYQIWGEDPQELLPGQSVTIPEGTIHWHGAQHTSWFQHLSIMKPGASTEWLSPVEPLEYARLK